MNQFRNIDPLDRANVLPNDLILRQAGDNSTDSDYFSEGEGSSPIDEDVWVNNNPANPVVCSVSDDWIELDLSTNCHRSLSFLSGDLFYSN